MSKFHEELVASRRRGAAGSIPLMTPAEDEPEQEAPADIDVPFAQVPVYNSATFCLRCGAVVAQHMTPNHIDHHRRLGF